MQTPDLSGHSGSPDRIFKIFYPYSVLVAWVISQYLYLTMMAGVLVTRDWSGFFRMENIIFFIVFTVYFELCRKLCFLFFVIYIRDSVTERNQTLKERNDNKHCRDFTGIHISKCLMLHC